MINSLDKEQVEQAKAQWIKRVEDIAKLFDATPHPRYDPNHWQRMYLANQFTLSFSNGQWRESEKWQRLHIELTPDWGLMSAHHDACSRIRRTIGCVTSMNVTLAKTDQQIVRGIRRRILPGCTLLYEELLKAKAAAEEQDQKGRRWFDALAESLGVKAYAVRGGPTDKPNYLSFFGGSISLCTRNGYGSVEISTTDPGHALAIGRLVKDLSKDP